MGAALPGPARQKEGLPARSSNRATVIENARLAPAAFTWRRIRGLALQLIAGVSAVALGLVLAIIASPFQELGPLVLIAIPLVPLAIVAVMIDPIGAPLIVAATLPAGSVGASLGPATLQLSEGAALAVGALIIIRRLAVGQSPLPFARELIWPVLLLGWTLVALYSAVDETLAIKQVVALLGGILLATVVLASCRDLRGVRVLLGFLTIIGLIVAVTSLSANHQFQASAGGAVVQNRLEGAFQSPNQFGSWCALVIPIAAGLMFVSPGRLMRFIAALSLLALLGTLIFSLSRSAWIGTGAAMLLLLFTLREARRLLAFILVPLILAGYLIFSFAPTPPEVQVVGERVRAIAVRSPYDDRAEIYHEALNEIREDPITGIGPGGFAIASRRAGTETSTVFAAHAHNLLLNYGAEEGLPAVGLVFAFVLAMAAATRRGSRAAARVYRRHRGLILSIAASLFAIFVQGFFDYTLGNPVIRITVWMLIGTLLVAVREADFVQSRAAAVRP